MADEESVQELYDNLLAEHEKVLEDLAVSEEDRAFFEERNAELEQGQMGVKSAGETADHLQQVQDLNEEIDRLNNEMENFAGAGGGAQQELNEKEQQLQTLREETELKDVEVVKLKNKIASLEAGADELSQKLHAEMEKARAKQRADGTSRKDAKSHRRELNRVLEENRELRSDIVDLESDRDKLIGAVEQLHDEVQESRKTLATLSEEKDDAVKREQIKDEQITALRHELEETQDERHVLEKIQGDHEAFVEQLKQRHDASTADTRRRLDHETREVARLTQENERLRDNTQVGALQIRLNKAEALNEGKKLYLFIFLSFFTFYFLLFTF